MLRTEHKLAGVAGLFSKFQPVNSVHFTPNPTNLLAVRLEPLQEKKAAVLSAVAADRDEWGQRLRVLEAKEGVAQDAALSAFHIKSRPLVGISDLEVKNGEVRGFVHPTPQVIYAMLSKRGAPEHILKLSKVMGTSGALIAPDEKGISWLQVQGRNSDRNFPHGGNLGCSPAGLFRYCYSDEGTKVERIELIKKDPESIPLIPVGDEQVIENIRGEAREELGIKDKSTLAVTIVGIAHDDTSPHYEILTRVDSSLTVDEINEIANAKIASLRPTGREELHPHDFTEAYSWIPATPEDIGVLIVNSPHSPATHIANWIAIGRQLVEDRSGVRDAQTWQTGIIAELSAKVIETANLVGAFYKQHPAAFFENLHAVEKAKLARIVGQPVEQSKIKVEIEAAATAGKPDAERIKKYLARIDAPSEQILAVASAMLNGVLHTPLDDCFDPRRTPEAQGLPSAVETFRQIEESGVQFYPGTMEF